MGISAFFTDASCASIAFLSRRLQQLPPLPQQTSDSFKTVFSSTPHWPLSLQDSLAPDSPLSHLPSLELLHLSQQSLTSAHFLAQAASGLGQAPFSQTSFSQAQGLQAQAASVGFAVHDADVPQHAAYEATEEPRKRMESKRQVFIVGLDVNPTDDRC